MPAETAATKHKWTPRYTAAAAFVVVGAALLAAFVASGFETGWRWTLPVIPAAAALIAGVFHKMRWSAWLDGFLFGAAFGAISALDLLRHPQFEGEYFEAMMNMVFFLALFFFLGAVAELVRLIHRRLHRGKPETRA